MLDKQFLKYKIEKYKNKRIYKDQDKESKRQARKVNAKHAQQEANAIHSYLTGEDRYRKFRNKSYIEGPLEGMFELEARTNMLNLKKPVARKYKRFIRHPIIWRRLKRYAALRLLRLRRMFKRMNIRFNPGHGRNNKPALEMDCDLRIGGDLIFFDSKRTNKLRGKAAATGYTELPNGIIMQWGIDTRNSDGEYTLVFPTPFQNACFSVVINRQATGATSPMSAVNITKTGFGVDRENGISGDQTINYIAIGN